MCAVSLPALKWAFDMLLPEDTKAALGNFTFCWKLTATLGKMLSSQADTFSAFQVGGEARQLPAGEKCNVCARFPSTYKTTIAGHEHVCTTDASIMQHVGRNCKLIHSRLCQMSHSHHPPMKVHEPQLIEIIRKDLWDAIERLPQSIRKDDFEAPVECVLLLIVDLHEERTQRLDIQ